MKGGDLRSKFDEMATRIAADDSRKVSLPQTPEAYAIALPEGFTPPADVQFAFDVNDPVLKSARDVAHKQGMSQGDFSNMLGVYAQAKIDEQVAYDAAKTENLKALGANGPQRIDAVTRWLGANFDDATVKPVLATLATTQHVTMFEKIIAKLTSQGVSNFTGSHRETPDSKPSNDEFSSWSYGEQREYQTTGKRPQRAA